MQCNNAVVHCKAFIGNHSLSQITEQSKWMFYSMVKDIKLSMILLAQNDIVF
jgi:hypothetical protein